MDRATVDAFRGYLEAIRPPLAPRTIELYVGQAQRADRWLRKRSSSLWEASPEEVTAYADSLPETHSSRNQVRCAMRHFYAFADLPDASDGLRIPKARPRESRALTEDEADRLAKAAQGWWPEGAAVLLGLGLALRASEIAAARWDRFTEDGSAYLVLGKGYREGELPVHPSLWRELRPHRNGQPYLFPGHNGRPYVTHQTIRCWVVRVAESVGLEGVTTHRLRHTCLATMNDATGDLRATSRFARHASTKTTEIYTRTTEEALRRVMLSLDYLDP